MTQSAVIPLFPSRVRRAFSGDDAALVQAIRSNETAAAAELFDRYGGYIQRVLTNILGFDAEVPDLLQEVFTRALGSIHSLNDGARLKAWLVSIAVFTARGCIRSRTRRRWLGLLPPQRMDEMGAPGVSDEIREALRCTYDLLTRLPADERIAFTLRHVNGMELAALAEVSGVSLATIKRRLTRARTRFLALARHQPALHVWLEEARHD